jgi:hypothetical protein
LSTQYVYEMPWFKPDPTIPELCELADTYLDPENEIYSGVYGYANMDNVSGTSMEGKTKWNSEAYEYYMDNDDRGYSSAWNSIHLKDIPEDLSGLPIVDDLHYIFKDTGNKHVDRDFLFKNLFFLDVIGQLPPHTDPYHRSCSWMLPLRDVTHPLTWVKSLNDLTPIYEHTYTGACLTNSTEVHHSLTNSGHRLFLSMSGLSTPMRDIIFNINIPEKFI